MQCIPILCVVVLVYGCEAKDPTVVPPTAASPLKQQVEGVVPEPVVSKPGLDSDGRLLSAQDLVAGFEVPMRAKLRQMHQQYLELELHASERAIREFYSGLDSKSGRRFSSRNYGIEQSAQTGDLNIEHTRDTLRRLKLDSKYENTRISIRKITHWVWEMRVYDVRRKDVLQAFLPDLDGLSEKTVSKQSSSSESKRVADGAKSNTDGAAAGATAAAGSRTSAASGSRAGGSGVASGSSAGATSKRSPKPEARDSNKDDFAEAWDPASVRAASAERALNNPPSTVGGIRIRPGQKTFQDHEKGRYGPYPASAKKSVRERVRQWQRSNPNKVFLD